MDAAAEQSWQQGMVSHSSMSLNFDQESWDDSVILDIFDEAIRSHRTKNGTKKKAKAKPAVVVPSVPSHHGKQTMATTTSSLPPSRKKVEFTSTSIGTQQRPEQNDKLHDHIPTSSSSSSSSPSFPTSSSAAYGAYSQHDTTPIHNQLDDAFNSMLMAWYQSGYATGRYQALLEISNQQQHQPQYPPHHHHHHHHHHQQQSYNSENDHPQEGHYQHQHYATNSSSSTTDNNDSHSSIPTTTAGTTTATAEVVEESSSPPPPPPPPNTSHQQLDNNDDT